MKRCPECRRDYYDDSLLYCLDDGTSLLDGPAMAGMAETAVMLPYGAYDSGRTEMPTATFDSKPSPSPADDLYFQGKFFSERGNPADLQKAIELFEEAIASDPNHALSYVDLARAYGTIFFFFNSDKKDLMAKSYALLQRALAIEPDLAQAHGVKGYLLWSPANGFPHEQAIAEFQAALALDPKLVEAHTWLAAVYFHIGLLEESEDESQTALKLDPSKNVARLHRAVAQSYAGRYKEALQGFRSLPADLSSELAGSTTAWCLLNLGRVDEASDLIRRLLVQFPADVGGQLAGVNAVVLAAKGDSSAAEAAIAEAIDKGSGFGHFHHTTHFIADTYAHMNRPADSVRYLHMTADSGFPCYPLFDNDPNLEAIRSDTEFQEFISEQRAIWDERIAKYGASSKHDGKAT
jgi:tetratricopeptide (TPR) repeat protein